MKSMNYYKIFIIGLMFWGSFWTKSYAQVTSFSENPETFLVELEAYINTSNKAVKPIFEQFSQDLSIGKYTPEQFEKIRNLSNVMLERKMRSNPYFLNYLEALNTLQSKSLLNTLFDNWMTINMEMLQRSKNSKNSDFDTFLAFCRDLFDKSTLKYSPGGLTWKVTTQQYEFGFEDVPFVKMQEHDVIGIRKVDSIIIKNTSGIYYPLEYQWKGDKGEVDWSRIGLSSEVYCTFGAYELDTKSNTYEVDKAIFYHPTYFDSPIEGRFIDKVIVNTGNDVSYPRFESYNKKLVINNIGDHINYRGGFRLEGTNVIGFGDQETPAEMDFLKGNGDLAINTKAQKYIIRIGQRIVAQDVETSLYFGEDSIYHPSIDFRFDIDKRLLTMTRKGDGSSKIAFFNSYHQLEMEVEKVAWQIDADSIEVGQRDMTNISNRPKKGVFESLAYYNELDYLRVQNIADYNPISTIKSYAEFRETMEGYPREEARTLDANELAKKFNPRLSLVSILGLLNNLVADGFIYYDSERETVYVKEKTFHYAEASRNKRDYDIIRAVSESRRNNGILNLNSQQLVLNGVDRVILSDSQFVAFKPVGGEIVFNKNRNIDFNGQVYAGFGIFWGNDFHFEYEAFQMRLDSVYEFLLRIPTGAKDEFNMPILDPLTTLIEDMTAIVEIDTSFNKSSRIPIARFPRLTSLNNSRVYYSDKATVGGSYKRDNFYFELAPFVIDSLDSFDPDALQFEGQLVSGGIFPQFGEALRVQQEDLSLGFTTQTPPEGYPLYEGKGRFYKTIKLGNKGLSGKGQMNYLGSTINADDFLFKPNQMTATSRSFDLEEQTEPVEFPNVHGEEVQVDWRPYKDSMYIQSKTKPFDIFSAKYQLQGQLIMTPGGVYGNGEFDWADGTLSSKSMRFGTFDIQSDTSNLNIKTQDEKEALAFSTKNVNSSIDFNKQLGKFKSNSTAINTEMPYTQYKTSMNEFEWDMKKKEIFFESTNDNAVFVSTHPNQYGLSFSGENANYNLETNLLKIGGVPQINVADALIIPNDGFVEIEANAKMKSLESVNIIADTLNRFHLIKDAKATIKSKRDYTASGGLYDYNIGIKEQKILFETIVVGREKAKELVTKASGSVSEADNFIIDNNVSFKGVVDLDARYQALNFKGFLKLNAFGLPGAEWFSINERIGRDTVLIPYNRPRNEEGKRLEVGIRIQYDSTEIYPLVMTAPVSQRDIEVFDAVGIIQPDNLAKVFRFGDADKIIKGAKRGNMVTFRNADGKVTTEGIYNMGQDLKGLNVKTAGKSIMYFDQNKIEMNLMLGLGFQIPDKLMSIMIRDLETNSFDVPEANYEGDYFQNALAEFVPNDKDLEKVNKELEQFNRLFLPKEITNQYSIIFGQLAMVWNPEVQSFLSKGSTLGLAYINQTPISKQTKAHVEFRMTRQRREMNVYIESSSRNYYYFNYQIKEGKGVVSIFSNNTDFMNTYNSMKKKELQFKTADIETIVLPTGAGAVSYFLRRAQLANE